MNRRRGGGRTANRRLSRRTQGLLAGVAVAVGVAGIVVTGGRTPGVGETFLALDNARWSFTFVVAGENGVGSLAADGVLDLRRDRCATAGRVLVGELIVNPASAPGDVHRLIDDAEAGTGVGRIVSATREGVHLPDGTFSGAMPLGALGSSTDTSLCAAVQRLVRTLVARDEPGNDEIDALVDADDAARGRQRLRLALDGDPGGAYRYELYLDGDGGRGIVVRQPDPAAAIVVASIHLAELADTGPVDASTASTAPTSP